MARGVKITIAALVAVLLLLYVLDRVAVRVVRDQIATQAQKSENLPTKPSVSIGGPLFLPQVLSGNYRDLDIDIRGSVEDGLRIDRVRSHLDGVRIPLSDIINGDVTKIPVDHLDADVELTFTDLNAYLAAQGSTLTLSPVGPDIRVSGTIDILGTSYPVDGTAVIDVEPAAVTYLPKELADGLTSILPPDWHDEARALLTIRIPVEGLPFNLELTSATVLPDRMRFSAAGQNVILDTTTMTG